MPALVQLKASIDIAAPHKAPKMPWFRLGDSGQTVCRHTLHGTDLTLPRMSLPWHESNSDVTLSISKSK